MERNLTVNNDTILWGGSASMGFSKSQMPEKSFQVTRRSWVTWRDFFGKSDLEKPILALLTHRIDIPEKQNHSKIALCPSKLVSESENVDNDDLQCAGIGPITALSSYLSRNAQY